MDSEQKQRRQSLRIIVSEALMTFAVILTVIALVFIVSGYWLNSNFEIERQGLLQISSVPTGADVTIDGDTSWMQRTNTSKVLKSGEHQVTLTKDDYDSWSKTINITEGLLYRVRYPRLFLKERQKEVVMSEVGATSASAFNDTMLLINETTNWQLVTLENEPVKTKTLDVSSLFQNTADKLLTAKITEVKWSGDSSHVLVCARNDTSVEWVLIDIKNPENSLNLNKLFDTSFNKVIILDGSATNLLALRGGNLHRINTVNKSISAVLSNNVISLDHYRDTVVFLRQNPQTVAAAESDNLADAAESSQDETNDDVSASPSLISESNLPYEVVRLDLSSEKITVLRYESSPAIVGINRFYDDVIITIVADNCATIYKSSDTLEMLSEYQISFSPNLVEKGYDSEFIVMSNGQQIATIDMEANVIREWSVDGPSFGKLHEGMLYSVNDGKLFVYDADGFNRREITENVSSRFPVTIIKNKWLYYISDGSLMREMITK